MISLYTGSVGSGKSYHAIELGLSWIRTRKNVIANFDVIPPEKYFLKSSERRWAERTARWDFKEDINVEYLMAKSFENEWFGKESQCLVIIDEAGIMFNSRDWQNQRDQRTKWIKFLSQSRKFGYDFIFVCQADRMIDRQIRGLVEYEVKHLKANNSFFLRWMGMFGITLFLYNYKWYQTNLKGNLRLSRFKKSVANRYDTMKIFDLDELVENMKMIYEGKVVPAAVLAQINIWEDQIKEKLKEGNEEKEENEEVMEESS